MIAVRGVPEVLDKARQQVTPVLRSAVATLTPEIRSAAEYHLGWADADGRPAGADSGKCVRPALALLSAQAAGADGSVSLPGGAAVELVHNFSLLHDDVIDGDDERRHRPTVWAIFGVAKAIITGDALLALAQRMLLDVPGVPGRAAARSLADATMAMITGQADDMAFETRTDVAVDHCLAMEAAKTGAILACASSIGAILADAPAPTVKALSDFGMHLGLAFQAVDDLLGIWGDPARTGKPTWSDLRQHKKTLPVTAALASADGYAGELSSLLASPELSETEVARAARMIEACGGRELTVGEAHHQLSAALAALESAPLNPTAALELAQVARFVADREH